MKVDGTFDDRDRAWMAQALALGALAEGTTSPNPRVGCVVVREGRVVGRGYHRAPGGPHAEVVAMQDAGEQARGSTVYVNLEPCAHQGRTPPCAELLVRSDVSRVVSAMQDPNPLVDGRGFARLREAGIRVDVGVLAAEARELNEPFVHWHLHHRPLITLKGAITLDGLLAAREGASRWITGAAARRFAHRLRLRADAIVVGAGTVRRDDPRLTVRLPGLGLSPRRVVLSARMDLPPKRRVFEAPARGQSATRIYTTRSGFERSRGDGWAGRADVVEADDGRGAIDLRAVVGHLASEGVQSILVEGGGRTFAGFLEAGLADRGALFQAPLLLGARGATPILDGDSVSEPSLGHGFVRQRVIPLGRDLLFLGRFEHGGSPCSPD
jgi:diaminohydroxyphosphoribosylaminopyrimidine deaminase/5-amino-6-(5-phosphoribosylamino)uracil reductase